jgi:predicted ribosomally synthesized peptide with SipW-like signal peptide
METQTKRGVNRRKVFAIVAGCAAIGIGATATLAAWTDSEWVFGGNGAGGPGIGTSAFSVQQSTDGGLTFTDEPDNPGGEIVFAPDALDLTPGDSVYAGVALRTAANSVAGDVTLQPAVAAAGIVTNDPGDLLFDALNVAIVTSDEEFDCDATAFLPGSPATLIGAGSLGSTGGSSAQSLLAESNSVQYYCFQVQLPDPIPLAPGTTVDDYMGRDVAPAWEFAAISS